MASITMNSRERVLAAIRRQPVDYVPCSQHVHPLTEVQRRGRPWNFPWAPPGEGEEYMAAVMGTDPVVGLWWMDGVCPAPEVTGRVWREGDLLHKAFETPAGVLHASVLANEQWPYGDDIPLFHDFCGHYREFWIKGERDVACLAHILQPPRRREELEPLRAAFDRGKALANRLGLATIATVGSGLSSALWMFGAERLCLLTIDDPGLVDAYLEVEHRWNLAILDLVLDWGVDIVQRNGFYESAEFYGPAMLQRFLARRLRKEAAVVHEAGRPFAYTMHSGIMPILDHLAGFDFDCISLFDIAFDSPDLGAVARKLSAMSFWTGPSNTFHMYAGPEVVRQAVRDVFAAFGKTGLILGAASSIHPTMPWENTLAMLEEWRRLR
jgi:uroporphyrinogen-III decarboxylase